MAEFSNPARHSVSHLLAKEQEREKKKHNIKKVTEIEKNRNKLNRKRGFRNEIATVQEHSYIGGKLVIVGFETET